MFPALHRFISATRFPEDPSYITAHHAAQKLVSILVRPTLSKESLEAPFAAQRQIAQSALAAAFGSVPIGAVTPMAGGASGASAFRVEVGDRRYLVRVEGRPSPLRNPHQYVSLRIAAEA